MDVLGDFLWLEWGEFRSLNDSYPWSWIKKNKKMMFQKFVWAKIPKCLMFPLKTYIINSINHIWTCMYTFFVGLILFNQTGLPKLTLLQQSTSPDFWRKKTKTSTSGQVNFWKSIQKTLKLSRVILWHHVTTFPRFLAPKTDGWCQSDFFSPWFFEYLNLLNYGAPNLLMIWWFGTTDWWFLKWFNSWIYGPQIPIYLPIPR